VYTIFLVATSFVFAPVAHMNVLYFVAAAVLGARFISLSLRLRRRPSPQTAMELFHYSILYLALLFVAMAVDVLVR
jgi:protoheme IX farnesyltransferase